MQSFGFTPFIDEPVFVFHKQTREHDPDYRGNAKGRREMTFKEYLDRAYALDDRDKFVEAFKGLELPPHNDDLPQDLFKNIYSLDAVKCASEVIYHDRGVFKFDIFDTASGKIKRRYPCHKVSTPLHEAASHEALGIIRLLLDAQHLPTISPYYDGLKIIEVSPLDLAIDTLWDFECTKEWKIKKSIFNLVVFLCNTSTSGVVEAARLLARKTANLDEVFSRYAREGKLVEMCVLLLAGCSPPSPNVVHCTKDIPEKEKTLELLQVFNAIGDKLSGYM